MPRRIGAAFSASAACAAGAVAVLTLFAPAPASHAAGTAPPVSAGHYVRTVSFDAGRFRDQSDTGVGCGDARDGVHFVLLDVGGQFVNGDGPYVRLSATKTEIGYPELVDAVDSFVAGYVACDQTPDLTVAVGTNNDGDFEHYPAAQMGADWADQVVDRMNPVQGITVRGANDIEAGFAGNQQQALAWEAAFLGASRNDLVFNGSADNCPDRPDSPTTTCAHGWTQALYGRLTRSGTASTAAPDVDRIQALPQIYTAKQARQWGEIQRRAGGLIQFAGSLTEHGSGPCDLCGMTPRRGWTLLHDTLSAVTSSPSLPLAVDLDIAD